MDYDSDGYGNYCADNSDSRLLNLISFILRKQDLGLVEQGTDRESDPAEQQVDITARDFLDVDGGKAVLLNVLKNKQITKKLIVHFGMEEQDIVDLCKAMQGNSSVKCLEMCCSDISPRVMGAITRVKSIYCCKFRVPEFLYDKPTLSVDVLSILRSNRTLTMLDLGAFTVNKAVMKAIAENSTLTHLHMGFVLLSEAPPAIASTLRVNTSLVALHLKEDEYPTEDLVQLESVLKHHNTSLTNLTMRTREYNRMYKKRIRPYLRRNRFLKLAKALDQPQPAILGAAIGRIAKTNDNISSASTVYWLLQKNIRVLVSLGKTRQPILPAKRSLMDLGVETTTEEEEDKLKPQDP